MLSTCKQAGCSLADSVTHAPSVLTQAYSYLTLQTTAFRQSHASCSTGYSVCTINVEDNGVIFNKMFTVWTVWKNLI